MSMREKRGVSEQVSGVRSSRPAERSQFQYGLRRKYVRSSALARTLIGASMHTRKLQGLNWAARSLQRPLLGFKC
jgi:hypothetical protein